MSPTTFLKADFINVTFQSSGPEEVRNGRLHMWIVIQGFHSWFLLDIIWLQQLVIFHFVYLKQNLIHNYFDFRHIFCIFPHMKTFPLFFPVKSTAEWLFISDFCLISSWPCRAPARFFSRHFWRTTSFDFFSYFSSNSLRIFAFNLPDNTMLLILLVWIQ